MTVKDIMTLLESPDRVRVIKDGEEIYNQYFANMEVDKDIVAQIGDAEVKRFRVIPEITHRKYKERGLIAPMKPEETPDYSFRWRRNANLTYSVYIGESRNKTAMTGRCV